MSDSSAGSRFSRLTLPVSYGTEAAAAASDDDEIMTIETKPSGPPPESDLPAEVQALIALIFDTSIMESTVIAMEYDVKKNPLGWSPTL